MKLRLITILLLFVLIVITMPFVIVFLNNEQLIMYGVTVIVLSLYATVYLFGGLAKLIIYGIYGAVTIIGILFLRDYRSAVIVISTLLFVLNPVANLERYLQTKLREEDILPLRLSLRKKYWPFLTYRKEMTEYYYLPQAKKLFTKKWYLRTRQIVTLVMLGIGTFLFLNELKNVAINLLDYNLSNTIIFYIVVALFILTMTLYKKGFTALMRVSITLIFIPIIYLIIMSNYSIYVRLIVSSIILTIGIIYTIYERVQSLKRVVYSSYHYFDTTRQWEVYANALYEPLVYNELFNLVGIYQLRIPLSKFEKLLNDILFYANLKLFIITAYVHDGKNIIIYTEYHQSEVKKAKKTAEYLKNLFDVEVKSEYSYDKNKQIYEKTFFHQEDYIVARTINLSELLLELSVETQLIISMIYVFESLEDIEKLNQNSSYIISRIPNMDEQGQFAARISAKSINSRYMIESTVRDMLLTGMLYKGSYVRVVVYY